MAKRISLNAVILGSILLARAEPPVTSYSITGDNAFEYNSNIIKDGQRENTDYYSGSGSSGHSLNNARSQSSLEDSLRGNSYNGFSQNTQNSGFQGFSSNARDYRDNLGASTYFMNDPVVQSTFDSYTSVNTNNNNNNNNNGDSSFAGYTQSVDQTGSEFNQFSNVKHKSPGYTRFADNLSGATNTGSFPELTSESSSFRDYSADAFRSHIAGGYVEGDQAFNREPSSLFNGPSTDYSYGKHKESMFGAGNGNKYANDVYSLHPETRYVRGNHGNGGRDYVSSMYVPMSASSLLGNLRGTSDPYGSGKYSKYNKYLGDYAGLNYLSKDPEPDYSLGNYGKGKVAATATATAFKESRPNGYTAQSYLSGPSHLTKIAGSYKGKPSYMSYSSSSPVGYATMPSLHGTYNGNSYTDSPMLRRYRSSSGHVPGHGSMYSGYY
ncbi:uncharacterized protein LOC143354233 [Halictus rubicundus]|uniref:uncharacterized protein LOC143354233 n=1 Tax=Halictus rubicundus TaxID=77578 RepID=UPI0040375AF5